MAPARSIQCIRRPPRSAPKGFASFGRTSSAISDCDSRTGRGVRGLVSFMDGFGDCCGLFRRCLSVSASARFGKPRLEEAFGHLLNSRVRMETQPAALEHAEFEAAVVGRKVVSLAHVRQANAGFVLARYGKTDRIPFPFFWKARAVAGVSEIAMRQLVSGRNRRSCAVCRAISVPASTKWQAGWMDPHGMLGFSCRHEERTSHLHSPQIRLRSAIVLS